MGKILRVTVKYSGSQDSSSSYGLLISHICSLGKVSDFQNWNFVAFVNFPKMSEMKFKN